MKMYKYGIYSGIAMVSIMALMSITGNYGIGLIKYLKYAALALFLFVAASRLKDNLVPEVFFQALISNGLKISFIAGLFLTIGTLILFLIRPEFAPMKFGVLPGSLGQALTVGIILLMESVVFGGIINLIIFQLMKRGAENVNA